MWNDPGFFIRDPPLDPGPLYEKIERAINGMREFALISAAVELRIFDYCTDPIDMAGLSDRTSCDTSLLGLMCECLVQERLLVKQGKHYLNSPMAGHYLTRSSPYSQVHYIGQLTKHMQDLWVPLTRNLTRGPVRYEKEYFFREFSLPSMADNAVSGRLQATIRAITGLPRFKDAKKMIDLGGGHGLYAIALTMQNPGLQAWVFDLPLVIPIARLYKEQYGAGRVHMIPGDFFRDEFGEGYDLVFSSSNPSGKSPALLPRIAHSLNEGGYFVNVQSEGGASPDPFHALEWRLWTFSGAETSQNGSNTKEIPFMTPEYRGAMVKEGLIIIDERYIRDNYRKDTWMKMVIAEKREKQT